MRTTIDIPANLKQKLIAYAAAHNLKGYSAVIVEALDRFFEIENKDRQSAIASLKGCLSKQEYDLEIKRILTGRKNWKK